MRGLLLAILGGALLLSCTTNRGNLPREMDEQSKMNTTQRVAPTQSAADTVVQFYHGGGVTGMYSGYQVSTSGEVKYFTRNAVGQTIQESRITIAPDSIRQLLKPLFSTGIFSHAIQKTGNVSSYFVYRDGNKTLTLSWVKAEDVPAAFQRWYTKAMQRCRQWIQKNP